MQGVSKISKLSPVKMDDDACKVKIVGKGQHSNYMLSITRSYTIGELKKKINVGASTCRLRSRSNICAR